MKRTTTVALLMVLATIGDRQWFRVEHVVAAIAQGREAQHDQAEAQRFRPELSFDFHLLLTAENGAALNETLRAVSERYAKL